MARANIKRKLGDQLGAQTDQLIAQEKIRANAGHPQIVVRLAVWLAIISVVLGLFGLLK